MCGGGFLWQLALTSPTPGVRIVDEGVSGLRGKYCSDPDGPAKIEHTIDIAIPPLDEHKKYKVGDHFGALLHRRDTQVGLGFPAEAAGRMCVSSFGSGGFQGDAWLAGCWCRSSAGGCRAGGCHDAEARHAYSMGAGNIVYGCRFNAQS